MLLQPELLSRIEHLALLSRQRTRGIFPGEHRSKSLGTSVDFADWREYVPGDDFRRIDHQIYARLDKLLLRLYEAEEELPLRIIVDGSASMTFYDKSIFAKRVAGALAYIAACRRDPARVWFGSGVGLVPSPWARSRGSALSLLGWLEARESEGRCDLVASLKFLASAGVSRGTTVLISDLMTESWEDVLRGIGNPGSEAVVVHVVSSQERYPTERGDLELIDSESQSALDVSMSEQVLSRYQDRVAEWLAGVSQACRRRGFNYVLVDPSMKIEDLILRQFRTSGVLR